jgi:hypothetical protein
MRETSYRAFLLGVLFLLFATSGFADFGRFSDLKKADDFVYDLLEKFQARVLDFKVSDPLNVEDGQEFPVELGFSFCEPERLPDLIDQLESFKNPDMALRASAVTVSVSAESRPDDGKVIVVCTMIFRLIKSAKAGKFPLNQGREMLTGIFETAHFEPGIQKRAKVDGVNIWLTNLRMDSDNRIQFTGYASSNQQLISSFKSMIEEKKVPGAGFWTMNANTYSSLPVWRFDATASGSKAHRSFLPVLLALQHLTEAVDSSNAVLSDIRISPAIQMEATIEYPMELSFKEIDEEQWKKLKKQLSSYSSSEIGFKEIGEIAGEERTVCLKVLIQKIDK